MSSLRSQRIHYIAGASGVGTSTRAFELRRAWEAEPAARPVLVIATDVIRAELRTAFDTGQHPDLFGESFNLTPRTGDHVRDGVAIDAFLRQCDPILRAVEAAVDYGLSEGWDVIAEGVHLVPGAFDHPASPEVVVTHELLVVEDEATHRSRFVARDTASDGRRSADHYLANLGRIRVVQDELRDRAAAAAGASEHPTT